MKDTYTNPDQVRNIGVGSDRGPSCFSAGGFLCPPSEPDVQLRLHPALHVFMPLLVQPLSASHVPAVRPQPGRANGAPVFTSDLRDQHFGCEHTGPLRHVTGFPISDHWYGSSAPSPRRHHTLPDEPAELVDPHWESAEQ